MTQDRMSWDVLRGEEIVPGRRVLKRLGGGSRYEAHLVSGSEGDVRYVVKVLRPDKVLDPASLRSLRREYSLLGGVDHPSIPRAVSLGDAGPRPHLVMTYLKGRRLSTRIRKEGPLPIDDVLRIGLALASALAHLHERDVLHLDVKPGNVIDGPVTGLIDLSVARRTADAAALTHHVGTDAYMAPETCVPRRLGPITSAADVWGLGATLYRAAAGEPPFARGPRDATSPEERWPALTTPPAPLPASVPKTVHGVVVRCLDPKPSQRPGIVEVVAAFAGLVGG